MRWTLLHLLLAGAPDELLPRDLAYVTSAAQRWAGDGRLREGERARIREVWLEGQRRPPFGLERLRQDEIAELGGQP